MTLLLASLRDGFFVFAVIFIWFMLIYQFVLTLGGFFLWRREVQKSGGEESLSLKDDELPTLSVLIPARNEALVIEGLLERLEAMDYPRERMEIIVVNDASTDSTAELVASWAQKREPFVRLLNIPPEEGGRGKAAALNRGLGHCRGEVIAVYDADNLPDRDALRKLAAALMANPQLAAVTGKFRAYNRQRNLLTRFINLESVAFQWIIQAGRWFFLRIAFLPGTNYVIRRSALESLGGWDETALTEDTELTLRLYEHGYRVKFLPTARTWEQEPERWSTWFRQRTRWARGNNHLILRQMKRLFRSRPSRSSLEMANLFYLYYLFVLAIIVSDIFFFLSLLGLMSIRIPGPFLELWILAFFLFIFEILVALSFEREDSPLNLAISILAYFTYTKLWALVVLRSFFEDFVRRKERVWIKTERFVQPERAFDPGRKEEEEKR